MNAFWTNTEFRPSLVPSGFPIDDGEVHDYGVLLGNRDTAVGVVEGTLDQLIEYFEDVIAQLCAETERRARYRVTGRRPRRGAYRLPQDSVLDGSTTTPWRSATASGRRSWSTGALAEVRILTLGAGSQVQYLIAWPGAWPGTPDNDESSGGAPSAAKLTCVREPPLTTSRSPTIRHRASTSIMPSPRTTRRSSHSPSPRQLSPQPRQGRATLKIS